MATQNIIQVGTAGVDMLTDPILLGDRKAHFTKNLEHVESRIRTRPSIKYHPLNIQGKLQGVSYHAPRFGLLVDNESINPCAIVTVVDGSVRINPILDSLCTTYQLTGVSYEGSTYTFSSEQYLIALNRRGTTSWHNKGLTLTPSGGTSLESNGKSHDTLIFEDHNHFLPNQAELGIYIHGRTVVSMKLGTNSSILLCSDLVDKRKHEENSEVLLMEEEAAFGAGITTSAKLGKTVALAVMSVGSHSGVSKLIDFREAGVAEHDLFGVRETKRQDNRDRRIVTQEQVIVEKGWDQTRITHEKLNVVSATGRYAVCEIPRDVLFGSRFGLHLYNSTIGAGVLNDEATDNISQDVSPLWKDNNDGGRAVGYWIEGNRFMATVNLKKNDSSTEPNGNAFVVANKSTTYTEDRTPRFLWEGTWQTDSSIQGIHRFIEGGRGLGDFTYGFIASDKRDNLLFGELTNDRCGYDYVVDEISDSATPIESKYITGFLPCSGLSSTDKITRGVIEFIADGSTEVIDLYVRSDVNNQWTKWDSISPNVEARSFVRHAIKAPSSVSEKGTYFQFKMVVKGNIEITKWACEYSKIAENLTGQTKTMLLDSTQEDYYD